MSKVDFGAGGSEGVGGGGASWTLDACFGGWGWRHWWGRLADVMGRVKVFLGAGSAFVSFWRDVGSKYKSLLAWDDIVWANSGYGKPYTLSHVNP